jgi:hypothetical protein
MIEARTKLAIAGVGDSCREKCDTRSELVLSVCHDGHEDHKEWFKHDNVAAAVAVDPLCAVLPVYLVYPVYSVSLIAAPALSQALLTLVIMTFARSSG